jgi:hypothetical protein
MYLLLVQKRSSLYRRSNDLNNLLVTSHDSALGSNFWQVIRYQWTQQAKTYVTIECFGIETLDAT